MCIIRLGGKIRQLRGTLTQDQVVNALGVTQQHLSRIESNKVVPSSLLLEKIARHFKCDLEELKALAFKERAPDEVKKYFDSFFKLRPDSVPALVELRAALLEHYDKAYSQDSLKINQVQQIFDFEAFHPIEKALLQKAHAALITKQVCFADSSQDPLDFFCSLNLAGKRDRLNKADFKWAIIPEKEETRGDTQFIYVAKGKKPELISVKNITVPDYADLRYILLEIYSYEKNDKIAKAQSPSDHKIIREIKESSFHPIERKILFETYNYLVAQGKAEANKDPIGFFSLRHHEPLKKVKEILKFWMYDGKKNILTIAFKTNTEKPLIKKFALWQEISNA